MDPDLRVGAPSSAAAAWVEELLSHVDSSGAPLDFVSTHTYGSPPLDLRPILERHDRSDAQIWWTEWGVTPQLRPAERRELRKPRFWALSMVERLGRDEVATDLTGDGAGGMVEAWAARDDDGRVTVILWNCPLDQSKQDGDPALDRRVTVTIDGLPSPAYTLRQFRVDGEHSNLPARWRKLAVPGQAWPDEPQWTALRDADRLEELAPPRRLEPSSGRASVEFDLPMPSLSFLELKPR